MLAATCLHTAESHVPIERRGSGVNRICCEPLLSQRWPAAWPMGQHTNTGVTSGSHNLITPYCNYHSCSHRLDNEIPWPGEPPPPDDPNAVPAWLSYTTSDVSHAQSVSQKKPSATGEAWRHTYPLDLYMSLHASQPVAHQLRDNQSACKAPIILGQDKLGMC